MFRTCVSVSFPFPVVPFWPQHRCTGRAGNTALVATTECPINADPLVLLPTPKVGLIALRMANALEKPKPQTTLEPLLRRRTSTTLSMQLAVPPDLLLAQARGNVLTSHLRIDPCLALKNKAAFLRFLVIRGQGFTASACGV